jgi:hypothetical protein
MKLLLGTCAFLACYSGVSSASFLFTTPGSGSVITGDGFSLGAEFTYNGGSGATITDLGLEDVGGETWDHSHEIGIWDVTAGNVQIADGTVDNSGILINTFRYVHLAIAVPLTPGDQYKIAAYYYPAASSSDHLLYCCSGNPNPTPDPAFSGFAAEFSTSGSIGSLSEPGGSVGGETAYIGPNFIFQTPEPATFALTGCGALGLLLIRKVLKQARLK